MFTRRFEHTTIHTNFVSKQCECECHLYPGLPTTIDAYRLCPESIARLAEWWREIKGGGGSELLKEAERRDVLLPDEGERLVLEEIGKKLEDAKLQLRPARQWAIRRLEEQVRHL